jgi:hypothetical protein
LHCLHTFVIVVAVGSSLCLTRNIVRAQLKILNLWHGTDLKY